MREIERKREKNTEQQQHFTFELNHEYRVVAVTVTDLSRTMLSSEQYTESLIKRHIQRLSDHFDTIRFEGNGNN